MFNRFVWFCTVRRIFLLRSTIPIPLRKDNMDVIAVLNQACEENKRELRRLHKALDFLSGAKKRKFKMSAKVRARIGRARKSTVGGETESGEVMPPFCEKHQQCYEKVYYPDVNYSLFHCRKCEQELKEKYVPVEPTPMPGFHI